MSAERILIVNADDFGRSPGVNAGVIRAFEEGILTSASLMVRWPDATPACDWARGSSMGVGLHLDLGEWVYRDHEWHEVYSVLREETDEAVRLEVGRQLEAFERLTGREPTHLDSHQHVHLREPARTALAEAGRRLGIPVRAVSPAVAYRGAFYGQDSKGQPYPSAITVEGLIEEIERLEPGVTELGCHPAVAVDHDTAYAAERVTETETLCDPRVRAAVERCGVRLRSFADLGA